MYVCTYSYLSIYVGREEAELRAKQTNQKYDEAEQKSQAWMKAKDEAQSHKRMWHSYWQQAMVRPYTMHCLNDHQGNCLQYMMLMVSK